MAAGKSVEKKAFERADEQKRAHVSLTTFNLRAAAEVAGRAALMAEALLADLTRPETTARPAAPNILLSNEGENRKGSRDLPLAPPHG